jgi:hypothetical protein
VSFEEAVDELEDDALVGGGELLDLLEALEEACGARAALFLGSLKAKELVRGDAEGFGEVDEHGAGGLGVLVLVVCDHTPGDADRVRQLGLGQGAGLADLGEAITEAFEGAFFHR